MRTSGVASKPNRWILGRELDLLLIVLTPLVVLPIAWLVQSRYSVFQIGLYVAAFGALGHHLPGMMRAYGDRALFARFRARFIVAPLFLVGVSMFCVHHDRAALTVILLLWGFWHGLMQVYGFLRIYDAKVGSTQPLTANLDFAMVFAWFGLALLLSGGRVAGIVRTFYASGGPLIPIDAIEATRALWITGTAVVTGAYLWNMAREWRGGRPPSPVKLATLTTSVGFYWYAMVAIHDPILGVALFEVFHDVQYLAIVWAYNGRLVQRGATLGRFTRFLFRSRWPLVALYVSLVLGYGALGLAVPELIERKVVPPSLQGLVIASAFLHFYFDGFIWKVRQQSTRAGLDLAGGEQDEEARLAARRRVVHGLKWCLFVLPLVGLGFAQMRHSMTAEHYQSLAEAFPEPRTYNDLGARLSREGRRDAAIAAYREAVRLDPTFVLAEHNLATLLLPSAPNEALEHFERVVALQPESASARLVLGDALRSLGRLEEAIEWYQRALALKSTPKIEQRLEETQRTLAAE